MFYFLFTDVPSDVTHAGRQWNILAPNVTNQAVVDELNQASALTVTVPGVSIYPDLVTVTFPWSGAGTWYDETVGDPLWINSSTFFTAATVNGLDAAKSYIFEFVGAYDVAADRVAKIRINSGTEVQYTIPNQPNVGTAQLPISGVTSALIEVAHTVTSSSYILGFRIYEDVPVPTVSITGTLQPGAAMSGSYSNWAGIPSVLSLTDTQGNSIDSATEITDLVITDGGDGTGTFTFTMPALPSTGSINSLLFGNVTAELT